MLRDPDWKIVVWQYFGKVWKITWEFGNLEVTSSLISFGSYLVTREYSKPWEVILEAGEHSDHLEAEEWGKSVEILWSSKEMWKLGNARRNF